MFYIVKIETSSYDVGEITLDDFIFKSEQDAIDYIKSNNELSLYKTYIQEIRIYEKKTID